MKCRNQTAKIGIGRGFTLIELMIVLVIMGVLAAVALLAYQTYIKRARTAEAAGLLANIKAAQESYRAEFGIYCDVDSDDPPGSPSPDGNVWNAVNVRWSDLGFRADNRQIYFSLNTIAGGPTDLNLRGWNAAGQIVLPVDTAEFTRDHWFIARARGDLDGDGALSYFWITHMTTGVDRVRETE